jgi:hypothetical protein
MKVVIHTQQHSGDLNIILRIKNLFNQIGAPFQTLLFQKSIPVRKMPEWAVYIFQADDIVTVTVRTAIASAFFVPTITRLFFARVMPV